VFASWTLTRGGRYLPGITAGALATLPTGDEANLLGSGTPVFVLSVLLTKQLATSPWLLFLGSSVSYSDSREMYGIRTRQTQFALMGGIEYRFNDRFSIIAQNLALSPIAHDFDEFSDPSSELNLGVRIRDLWGGDLDFSLQENLFYFNNSPDMGIHLSYRRVL
jgi:hypothetical protein